MAFALADHLGTRELMLWKYFFLGIVVSEVHERVRSRLLEGAAWLILAAGMAFYYIDAQVGFDWFGQGMRHIIPWEPQGASPVYTVGLALACFGIFLGSICSPAICRLFAAWPWRVLATVSYSVFIWHGFILIGHTPIGFNGTGGLLVSGISPGGYVISIFTIIFAYIPAYLFAGIVSFLLFEHPFLMLRSRTRRRASIAANGAKGSRTESIPS